MPLQVNDLSSRAINFAKENKVALAIAVITAVAIAAITVSIVIIGCLRHQIWNVVRGPMTDIKGLQNEICDLIDKRNFDQCFTRLSEINGQRKLRGDDFTGSVFGRFINGAVVNRDNNSIVHKLIDALSDSSNGNRRAQDCFELVILTRCFTTRKAYLNGVRKDCPFLYAIQKNAHYAFEKILEADPECVDEDDPAGMRSVLSEKLGLENSQETVADLTKQYIDHTLETEADKALFKTAVDKAVEKLGES